MFKFCEWEGGLNIVVQWGAFKKGSPMFSLCWLNTIWSRGFLLALRHQDQAHKPAQNSAVSDTLLAFATVMEAQ